MQNDRMKFGLLLTLGILFGGGIIAVLVVIRGCAVR